MNVYLTSSQDSKMEQLNAMLELSRIDKHKAHPIVDDPQKADLILFVEEEKVFNEDNDTLFNEVVQHPLRKKYLTKTLIFIRNPNPFYVIPGLYVSPSKSNSDLIKQKATTYIRDMNELIDYNTANTIEPDILYSFMGKRLHILTIRDKLLSFDHPMGEVVDTTGFHMFKLHKYTEETIQQRKKEYADLLARSKFILFPRGLATSSYRLYETMQVGRVPVIISDDWVPPDGPNWNEFSIFVKEKHVKDIQNILKAEEQTWKERGNKARQAWETYFAPDVRYHYMIEQCKHLLEVSDGQASFFESKLTINKVIMWFRYRSFSKVIKKRFLVPLVRKIRDIH